MIFIQSLVNPKNILKPEPSTALANAAQNVHSLLVSNVKMTRRIKFRVPLRTRRELRLSYVLRESQARHRLGVRAVAVHGDRIFTASRDSTILEWLVPPNGGSASGNQSSSENDEVPCMDSAINTFDEHSHWVNDIVLMNNGERLISCSNDTTVKVWNSGQSHSSLRTLTEHSDYVQALAPLPMSSLASASLDGSVLVWDLARGQVKQRCSGVVEGRDFHSAFYCLASAGEEGVGDTIAAGSTDKALSLFDFRNGERFLRVEGHNDYVRCVIMKFDGTQILSGSTDTTVKLWDVRMGACVWTFKSPSSASIWAIDADRNFDWFVSGCRDGSVWRTEVKDERSSMVVAAAQADVPTNRIQSVALADDNRAVWVSTTGSTVRLWPLERAQEMGAPEAVYQLSGFPAITEYKILNNQRHAVTCDKRREFCKWDITCSEMYRSLGVLESQTIDEVASDHNEEVYVPSWCTAEIRLGSLTINLVEEQVFAAVSYALDADIPPETPKQKVNIGEQVVRGLFATWRHEYESLELARKLQGVSPEMGERPVEEHETRSPSEERPQKIEDDPPKTKYAPGYGLPHDVPIIVEEGENPLPLLKRRIGTLEGDNENNFPSWVLNIIRDNNTAQLSPEKLSLDLAPLDPSKLPSVSARKVDAPPYLTTTVVAAHIAKEIRDLIPNRSEMKETDLDILCNGRVIPPEMNLGTVKHFRWRSEDVMRLFYSLR